MLHSAILRAVSIGNRAGINPITERLDAEAKRESIAQARGHWRASSRAPCSVLGPYFCRTNATLQLQRLHKAVASATSRKRGEGLSRFTRRPTRHAL